MLTACVWAGSHARARARAGRARQSPVKRHRGEPGHTRDTRDTRAHAGTRITRTNLTTIHSNPTCNDTPAHENRDRLNSRKNNRKPGVDRSLPVQHSTVPVPGCSVPVKRHWGEPGHTRETRDTRVQRHRGSRDTQETDTEHHKPTSKTGTVATSTFCIHVVPRAPFPIGGDPYPGLSVYPP